MELDNTRIAIRERGFLDILDLALRVVRENLVAVALLTLLGALPCFLVNFYLFYDEDIRAMLDPESDSLDVLAGWFAYSYLLAILVLIEIPLATAPLTLYLGQKTFTDQVNPRQLLIDLAKCSPQLLLIQLCIRALFIPLLFTCVFPFVVWPYLNEIILLERNPLWKSRGPGEVSTLSRISLLHTSSTSELLSRAIGSALFGLLLTTSIWLSLWSLHCVLAENWSLPPVIAMIYLQVAIWIVVGFFAVVRFLSYLDLRIRNEGWELELRMRAEGNRLRGQTV